VKDRHAQLRSTASERRFRTETALRCTAVLRDRCGSQPSAAAEQLRGSPPWRSSCGGGSAAAGGRSRVPSRLVVQPRHWAASCGAPRTCCGTRCSCHRRVSSPASDQASHHDHAKGCLSRHAAVRHQNRGIPLAVDGETVVLSIQPNQPSVAQPLWPMSLRLNAAHWLCSHRLNSEV